MVVVATLSRPVFVRNGRIDRQDRSVYVMAETGRDGRFDLPPQEAPYSLVVLHDRGFAEIKVGRSEGLSVIKLRPWGRVEGTLRIGSQPGAKETIRLEQDQTYEPQSPQVSFSNEAETDARGRFVFDRVVPGELVHAGHVVYRDNLGESGSRVLIQAHSASIEVSPGRTSRVDLGGTGRPVIGRVALPAGFDMGIDWSLGNPGTGGASTSLKLEQFVPYPRSQVTPEAKAQWLQDWLKTEPGKVFQRAERRYDLEIKPDGTFRVEDVPPGTYTLTIAANWANTSRGGILETLGVVGRTVDVAVMPNGRSDQPLDLGTLHVKFYKSLRAGDPAPALDVTTLDGAHWKLADLRGKYVLLDFWATWCGPCRDQLPQLKDVHDAFVGDPRFVMVGLSLDQSAAGRPRFLYGQERDDLAPRFAS